MRKIKALPLLAALLGLTSLSAQAADTCWYSGNQSQGGTAVYSYNGYTWSLNGTVISKSSASIISYGGKQYRRGAYVTTWSSAYYSIQAYQLCEYNPNAAPAVADDGMALVEDGSATITLKATDPDAADTHTFTVVTPPPATAGSVFVSVNKVTFTPSPNWNGTTTFTYKATDQAGAASNIATVTVTVSPVNDAPTAANGNLATTEDKAASMVLPFDDVDLSFEGDSHTIAILNAPSASAGTAALDGGKLTFTPAPDWYGTTSLTYQVTDRAGVTSNVGTITINVTPVNDAPVAQPKTITTNEDTASTVTLSATDIDSPAPSIFEVVSGPANGSASISGSTLTFSPVANWNGSTTLTYRAQDSAGAWSALVMVSITVIPVNDAPTASNATLTTPEDTAASITLLYQDVDLSFEGDSHTVTVLSTPAASAGTVTVAGTRLSFTPAPDWNGTTSVTFQVTDRAGVVSNMATISIVVTPVNDAPIAQNKSITIDEDTQGVVTLSATDIDSSVPSVFELVTRPDVAQGSLVLAGATATFTPVREWSGQVTYQYRAQDSSGAWSALATVTVLVLQVNDTPEPKSSVSMETKENRAVTVKAVVNRL